MKRALLVTLVVLLGVVSGGCRHKPSEQEQKIMAKMKESMQTQCMGRYLVDLPASFRWLSPDLTLYYGTGKDFSTINVKVLNYNSDKHKFKSDVADRKSELSSIKNAETGKSNLLSVQFYDDKSVMFTSYKNSGAALGRTHGPYPLE